MEKLTTTLLTGAAMTALTVAPAMAQHHQPRMSALTPNGAITLKGNAHFKSGVHNPGKILTTFTFGTYSYSLSTATAYKVTLDLVALAFYTVSSGGHCVDYQPQKWKAVKGSFGKSKLYSTKQHVTLTACTGSLTYHGPTYELKSKTATHDRVSLRDTVGFTTTTTTTGTKHKQKHHKHAETAIVNYNLNIH